MNEIMTMRMKINMVMMKVMLQRWATLSSFWLSYIVRPEQVAVYSLLPVRHLGNLDLRAESGEEEELKLAVASTFFVTVQTTTRKLQVVQSPLTLLSCPS